MKLSKKVLSLILSVVILASLCTTAFASKINTQTTDFGLKFDQNGKFRILQVADIQDKADVAEETLKFISSTIGKYDPDLLVLTGDNTISTFFKNKFEDTVKQIVSSFNGKPYAVTFGNHDTEYLKYLEFIDHGYTRQGQYDYFVSKGGIDFDNNFSYTDLGGVGTGCIPILTSDGKNVAWNVTLFDTGTYDDDGGYGKAGYKDLEKYNNEAAYNEVVNWFRSTNNSLKKYTVDGDYAPTLCFQHIPLREFYYTGILTPCEESDEGAYPAANNSGFSGHYKPNYDNQTVNGDYLESCSCSHSSTLDMYKALAEKGNVKGIFYGHDHKNSLMGEGVYVDTDGTEYTLVQGYTKACTSYAYNDGDLSLRLFELDIDGSYTTETIKNSTIGQDILNNKYTYIDKSASAESYVSEISFEYSSRKSTAKERLEKNGYTVIDKDLNAGAHGDYVYMGYKKSSNRADALTDIKLSCDVGDPYSSYVSMVNNKKFTYSPLSTIDLNEGAGGDYIYAYYTKELCSGGITDVRIDTNKYLAGYKTATWFSDLTNPADLNKGAEGEYIYIHYKTNDTDVQYDIKQLQNELDKANSFLLRNKNHYSNNSINNFESKINAAQDILDSYKSNPINTKYDLSDIIVAGRELRDAYNQLAIVVHLDANGGILDDSDIEVVIGLNDFATVDLSDIISTTDDDNLHFVGWSTSENAEMGNFKFAIDGSVTLYAVWSNTPLEEDRESDSDSDNHKDTDTSIIIVYTSDTDDNTDTNSEKDSDTESDGFDSDTSTNTDTSNPDDSDTDTVSLIHGDVNCDGKITMEDVTSLQKIIAKLNKHTDFGLNSEKNSDCNGDKKVNMTDVTQIQKYLAHLIKKLG
ncbi:MAG: metallophosphoesterase [Clostridia bacterium]|nr:metallophosphoesterase [Clostridia bacterium]